MASKRSSKKKVCKKEHTHNSLTCVVAQHPHEVIVSLLVILIVSVIALILVTISFNQCRELIF